MTGEEERAPAGSGIIAIDKPRGPTSHQVTAWVGEMLGVRVGHSGTLDPQVSGVLLVMYGNTVRLAPILLKHDKEYICLMRLHGDVPREAVEAVAREFTGRIYQRPPRRSAVKRSLRIRRVHELEILDMEGRLVLFRVRCEAGTYIRSLCSHMGLALGVGAQMQELRRTRSGPFDDKSTCTLHELRDACELARAGDDAALRRLSLPLEEAVADVPRITVRDTAVDALCRGASLAGVGVTGSSTFSAGETVAVFTRKEELVCTGKALVNSSSFRPGEPGLVMAPHTVLMKPGTYEKGWKKARR